MCNQGPSELQLEAQEKMLTLLITVHEKLPKAVNDDSILNFKSVIDRSFDLFTSILECYCYLILFAAFC